MALTVCVGRAQPARVTVTRKAWRGGRERHRRRRRRRLLRCTCGPFRGGAPSSSRSQSRGVSLKGGSLQKTQKMIAVPAVGARSNFPRGILGFVFGFVFAFALGLVGVKYITLVPQYSESARARARRLNEAERNQWDWPSANPLTPARGSETVEWLNAALRKVWRVYMKQIERWIENR